MLGALLANIRAAKRLDLDALDASRRTFLRRRETFRQQELQDEIERQLLRQEEEDERRRSARRIRVRASPARKRKLARKPPAPVELQTTVRDLIAAMTPVVMADAVQPFEAHEGIIAAFAALSDEHEARLRAEEARQLAMFADDEEAILVLMLA